MHTYMMQQHEETIHANKIVLNLIGKRKPYSIKGSDYILYANEKKIYKLNKFKNMSLKLKFSFSLKL